MRSRLAGLFAFTLLTSCASGPSGLAPVRPPRPEGPGAAPIPDPPPSRVVLHATVHPEGIQAALERAFPATGDGRVELFAGQGIKYDWTRQPFAVRFDRGRVLLSARIDGSARALGAATAFTVDVVVGAEPIVTPDYRARVQSVSVEVKVDAPAMLSRLARHLEERMTAELTRALDTYAFDARPMVAELHQRLTAPLPFAVGTSSACASLAVTSIEAGPTILQGSYEKDVGLVILPAVTLPCAATSTRSAGPPPLANVPMLPSGPFAVVVPVAAAYDELTRALDAAIGGRLHFSKDYPDLFLEKPEVFPSREALVIKMNLGGTVRLVGGDVPLGGELYFAGRPQVVDNQLVVPDLSLTPGSVDGLLRIKLAVDRAAIEQQAQAAMRLDLSERFQAVRHRLSKELSFGEGGGCVRAEVLRTEVTGIHPHASFLRLYATVHAQASLTVPCRRADARP